MKEHKSLGLELDKSLPVSVSLSFMEYTLKTARDVRNMYNEHSGQTLVDSLYCDGACKESVP